MKKIKILSIIFCFILCIISVGCSSDNGGYKTTKYKEPENYNITESGIVAENQLYQMKWDADYGSVTVVEKSSNRVWSTIPPDANDNGVDEFGFPIEANPRVNSPIYIQYVNQSTRVTEFLAGYPGSVSMDTIDCEILDNGIKVTYYFADVKIAVPVLYTLRENGMSISLNPKEVKESGNQLLSVTLAPYLCSMRNTADKNDFIFVPSGSGALIHPKTVSSTGITYSEQMYGQDATMQTYNKTSNTENLLLPVYGVKNGSQGALVVIEKGAESSMLEGIVGSETLNYSNVGATFILRGYDVREVVAGTGTITLSTLYADSLIENEVSICIYPLTDGNATLNGMADIYKKHLKSQGYLTDKQEEITNLHLEIYGGTMITKSFLGIPYKTMYGMTTLSEAQSIVEELYDVVDSDISIELKGFGSTGLDIQKIAGDYKISNSLGNNKQFKELQKSVKDAGGNLYMNFDILSIGKSANGYSFHNNVAKGPTGLETYQYGYKLSIRERDEDIAKYGLLSRGLIDSSAKKLIKKTEILQLEGIGIGKLSNISYSDYDDIRSYSKANMSSDAQKAINIIKSNSGKKVLAEKANLYAAILADEIANVPIQSGKHDAFDYDVPFYQMIFRGYINLSSPMLNTQTDKSYALLKSVESGIGISYSLINNFSSELINVISEDVGRSLYSDVKEDIVANCENTKNYYHAIGNSEIVEYEILNDNLRKTVFSNGTVVYVNYGENDVPTVDGNISAKDFLVKEAG